MRGKLYLATILAKCCELIIDEYHLKYKEECHGIVSMVDA